MAKRVQKTLFKMVTTENVLLGVLLNVVLLESVHQKSFESQEFTVKSGLSTVYFELKPVTSIKKIKTYPMGRPTTNRHRNIWDMNEGYRSSACRAALVQKDSKSKSSIIYPFDEGSAGIYQIDGMYETIAYQCPSVPPLYLEGRVDMDKNRAHIVVLFQGHHHRTSPPEDRYDLSATSGSPHLSSTRYSSSASSSSPANSKSVSPPSSPNRYVWSGSAFPSPYSQPKYREASYKPATAPKYREIPSKPIPYSSLPTASRLPSRFSSGNSSPSAHSQPAKRSFGLGQFIIRLVS